MKKRANTKLLSRGDTFLGVSEGLGEDLNVNPVWFRVGFIAMLFWNWQVALIAYFTTAIVLYAIRAVMPDYRVTPPAATLAAPARNDSNPAPEALAA